MQLRFDEGMKALERETPEWHFAVAVFLERIDAEWSPCLKEFREAEEAGEIYDDNVMDEAWEEAVWRASHEIGIILRASYPFYSRDDHDEKEPSTTILAILVGDSDLFAESFNAWKAERRVRLPKAA